MMKNLTTPANADDVKTIITNNLDRAAKLNFAQVQQESHLEGFYSREMFFVGFKFQSSKSRSFDF